MNACDPIFLPKGFKFSAVAAGIKASGKPDLALISPVRGRRPRHYSQKSRGGCSGGSRARSSRQQQGRVRAVIVNSGNANCATGKAGIRDCKICLCPSCPPVEDSKRGDFPVLHGHYRCPLPTKRLVRVCSHCWRMRRFRGNCGSPTPS